MRISATGRRRCASGANGFTLLELLVVITLIVIMAAAVIPQFLGNPSRGALKNASNWITNMMWYCHSSAAFAGQTFRLNYEPKERRFWISRRAESADGEGEFVPWRESGMGEFIVPDVVEVRSFTKARQPVESDSKELFVEFADDGTSEPAGIVLADADQDACTIVVSEITSQIRVVEGDIVSGPRDTGQEQGQEEEEE